MAKVNINIQLVIHIMASGFKIKGKVLEIIYIKTDKQFMKVSG